MTPKNPKVFLDTSVLFAAVLSATGGARKLFLLAEAGLIRLLVGPTVLKECDEVIQRKAPGTAPQLAKLLATGQAETSVKASQRHKSTARTLVSYAPDAQVLAEALQANPDWFVTHDKEHFLRSREKIKLPFEIGTPGDLLQRFKEDFTLL